ncbi:hypothetical protein LPJ56_002052 [Coemansia sp. RSA 2599]|nr:hypothetical protein LPJ56_002052 [Coemansia sp. RSA 2599]
MSTQASAVDSSSPQQSRESTTEPLQSTLQQQENSADSGKGNNAAANSAKSVRFLRACDNCRRRKVKCDGGKPSCAHCNRVDAPCHYSIKPKSRRMWKCLENADDSQAAATDGKAGGAGAGAAGVAAGAGGAGDKAVDDLTARLLARVETMERLLMQRNGVSSPRVQSGLGVLDEFGGGSGGMAGGPGAGASGLRQQLAAGISGSASMASLAAASMADAAANPSALHATPGANGIGVGVGIGIGSTGASHFHYHPQGSGGPTAPFSRSGSIVPTKRDGEGGPSDPSATPRHLAGMLATPLSGSEHAGGSDTHSHHHSSSTAAPGIPGAGAGGLPSLDVIKDLVDTLFTSNCHIVELIHEATFRRQFAAGTLSPLLLYSALASAARYSKNPAVRTDPPYSASAVFINKAKTLVVDAMEEPSLGNAQGLMIMCMMHFSLGNEVATTFYKALALNMCILLGYNRIDSVNGPVQPTSNCGHELMASSVMSMDWVDREAARRLWWTIFSIENYSSVCMGLAPSIQAEYCDVNLPATSVEWKRGKPDSALDDELPTPAKRSRLTPNPRHQLSAYHAQLSLIFSKVAWLVTRINTDSDEAVAQFSELNSVLQRWYEVLPKELRLSSVDTVLYGQQDSAEYHDICVLHMRFYTTVIQLNHAIPEFTDDPALIEPGQRKCVIAASRISDLLRTSFEVPVEFRDMNWYMCVFRAAHIHIYRLLSRDNESIARAKQDLAIHRRHLREGGPMWRICYKLLSRLDDMEQMVMLLPAQIPVSDLIRLKNLTRKGKAQLVNMQLDTLIKPSLIQTENGENEDLPLLARAELASKSQYRQQTVADIITSSAGAGANNGSGGFAALMNSPASSNLSSAGSAMQHSFASLPQTLGPLDMSRSSFPVNAPPHLSNGIDDERLLASSSAIAAMAGTGGASEVAPINTNIVIDNNMAETLVNYFYMVASNQSQGDSQSRRTDRSGSAVSLNSPSMMSSNSGSNGGSSGNSNSSSGILSGLSNAPPMGSSSLAALSAAAATTATAATSLQSFIAMQSGNSNSNSNNSSNAGFGQMQSPQIASMPYATTLQQQQQQQQTLPPLQNPQQQQGLFGRLYDAAAVDLQSMADNARSFV